MTNECRWCKYQQDEVCPVPDDCDFRSLKFEKGAIIARAKKEARKLAQIRAKIVRMTYQDEDSAVKAMGELMDLAKALEIMVLVLQTDFGMERFEVRKIIKEHRMSILEKAKMASMMMNMNIRDKKKIGGKRGAK